MTDAPKTEAEIQADYERGNSYFRDKYTLEEYRERFYFERDLVEQEALNIVDDGGTTLDVVEYVLFRVATVYGTFNNGCSCCQTTDLALELGYADEDDLDTDDDE